MIGTQLTQQLAQQQGLARPHLTGHLDEALPLGQGHAQDFECLLVRWQAKVKFRVRGEAKGRCTQTKMG